MSSIERIVEHSPLTVDLTTRINDYIVANGITIEEAVKQMMHVSLNILEHVAGESPIRGDIMVASSYTERFKITVHREPDH